MLHLLSFAPTADQPGPEHPAPKGRVPARWDPGWRGPGSDPPKSGQPHLHVLPGCSLHGLSNPVAPFTPPSPPKNKISCLPPALRPTTNQSGSREEELLAGNGTKGKKKGFLNAKIRNGDGSGLEKRVNMYSIRARSSYGRVCASYFCIVGLAKDSTDGRNITSEENTLLLLLLHLTSISCLWIILWLTRTVKGLCDMAEEQKRNDSTKTPEMVTRGHYRDISASCVESSSAGVSLMVDGREEIEKFYSGHLFSLSHSLQLGLLHLPVYTCQTWIRRVCLIMSTRVVLNHPAAGKTLMLTLRSHVQDFLLFKVRLLHQGCTARLFHIQLKEAENKLVLHVAC